jgi:membrane fusion protein (multidrug efflux system)
MKCLTTRAAHAVLLIPIVLVAAGCGGRGGGGGPGSFSVMAVVAEAKTERVERQVSLVGSLSARDMVRVAFETDGVVATIAFTAGAGIAKGDLLAELNKEKAKARLDQAEASHKLAEADYHRGRDLLASATISQQEFDRVEAAFREAEAALVLAKEELRDTSIHASFDGQVGERLVSVGQFVTRGMPLTTVVRMDPLDVSFNVPERYLGELELGQSVAFSVVAYPDRAFQGKVVFIDPTVSKETRTVLVKAEVANGDGRLRPGMYGNLSLVLGVREDAVTVPEAAILHAGRSQSVVVRNADGVAEFRPVTVGDRLEGRVVVTQGLAAGEQVVVEGHQKLGPGVPITVSPPPEAPGPEPAGETARSA